MLSSLRLSCLLALSTLQGCTTISGDSKAPSDSSDDKSQEVGDECKAGVKVCNGETLLACGESGVLEESAICVDACDDTLGCVTCKPQEGYCQGEKSFVCKPDGSGYEETLCDPVQGMSCDGDTGYCAGACSPQELGHSYIGCEYYPTVTANDVNIKFDFAVIVSNTSDHDARVEIEGGATSSLTTHVIRAHSVEVIRLPWVPLLKACYHETALECGDPTESSAISEAGAFHLRSNQPVTVYQFNPLDYKEPGSPDDYWGEGVSQLKKYSYSNDASLLIPVNAMTGDYTVTSMPHWDGWPGFVTVTASQDDTQVTVTAATRTRAGNNLPALLPGSPQTITLHAGDVAQFLTQEGDLTGSTVQADKPVQVIGGHYCTQIPVGQIACDHLEESMFPTQTLGNDYLVTAPTTTRSTPVPRLIRVVATKPNTELVYDPPQPTLPSVIADSGAFIDITTDADFRITANAKILVSQHLLASKIIQMGDPAMALAVPSAQYRNQYQFHAPTNYSLNYVNVVAPKSATITYKGQSISGWTDIGETGYRVSRIQLTGEDDGDYELKGDEPFGIEVYGYGRFTSYYYPGGLDLAPITVD